MTVHNTVTVHRPDLTPEEREHRMERIRQAAERLIIAAERAKEEKHV